MREDGPHAGQPVATAGTPIEQARAAMILVHGRNAAPANILDIARTLDRPGFAFLAPAAAGRTWYPHSFMADTASNEPGLSSGLAVLEGLVSDVLARGMPPARLVLLGFSQGACLTAEYAVRHPRAYGGVIVYSGGLIGPPGTTWDTSGSFDGATAFLGCSDIDSHVPKTRVDESAAVFEAMGAAVTKRIYPSMAHTVNDDEIAFTRALMDRILEGPA
jgi:predicted esterase